MVEIIVGECSAEIVGLGIGGSCHGHGGYVETSSANVWLLNKSTHNLGVQPVTSITESRLLYIPGYCGALVRARVGMWRTSA